MMVTFVSSIICDIQRPQNLSQTGNVPRLCVSCQTKRVVNRRDLRRKKMLRRHRITTDQVFRIIKEVKKRPPLWNREHEDFNNVFCKGMAWKTIASQLGLSEDTVKLKWKNIRDTFHRIINKNPEYAYAYTGDWPFFQEMLFLITSPRVPKKPQRNFHTPEYLELEDSQDFVVFSIDAEDESTQDVLPHTEGYYDLLFLESLAPYFEKLDPVRRVTMRVKIQDMLMREISLQNENSSQVED